MSMTETAILEHSTLDFSAGSIDFDDLPNVPDDYRSELIRLIDRKSTRLNSSHVD